MAVIAGKILSNKKHIVIALTEIHGVGKSTSIIVCNNAKIQLDTKVSDLTEDQLEAIRNELSKYTLEGDLRREKLSRIKMLIQISSYRGSRHVRNLPMRKRTKTNAQTRKKRKAAV